MVCDVSVMQSARLADPSLTAESFTFRAALKQLTDGQ